MCCYCDMFDYDQIKVNANLKSVYNFFGSHGSPFSLLYSLIYLCIYIFSFLSFHNEA